jgi:hypothetical protein
MFSLNFKYKAPLIAAVTALATSFSADSAMAVTMVHTEVSFDAANVPASSGATYTIDGYQVSPINKTSGNCETGDCTGEATSVGQGIFPSIVRTVAPFDFDLNGFWFTILGQGNSTAANFFGVRAFSNNVQVAEYSWNLAGPQGSPAATLLDAYTANDVSLTWVAGETPSNGPESCKTTEICKAFGYQVTLGALSGFKGIDKVSFFADDDANGRLDTIKLSHVSAEIPVPAGLPLLLTAMGLGGVLSWRKRKTA